MLYMYGVPRAMGQHHGVAFDGVVAYRDHEVPHTGRRRWNETFIGNLAGLVRRLSASELLPAGSPVPGNAGSATYLRLTVPRACS